VKKVSLLLLLSPPHLQRHSISVPQ
jgi:hypothetical protein